MKLSEVIVALRRASDTTAELELRELDGALLPANGSIYGPTCQYARTLPVEYRVAEGRAVIPEPCYWSPRLPFLYELSLSEDASLGEGFSRTFGVRRLSVRRGSFYWDSRRVVLRGVRAGSLDEEFIQHAHAAEASLIVSNPSEADCELCNRLGVGVIADLRASKVNSTQLHRTAVHASVAMLWLNGDRLAEFEQQAKVTGAFLAQNLAIDQHVAPTGANAFVVELDLGDRPPAWLRSCDKPVIAIRRGAAYADFLLARAACDKLQAELAPEFDLAGYFVGG